MKKDSKFSIIFFIMAMVLVFANLILFAPRITGGGNKEIYAIVLSFAVVPSIILEYFFSFFRPFERFEKEKV